MNRWLTSLLISLGLGLSASAAAQTQPAAPANGLRDDTRALTEARRAELATEIASCRSAVQADVWLTASTFLSSAKNIRLHARELRQHWSPGKDAILLAYDRSSDSHAISFSPGLWQRYPSAEIIAIMQRSVAIMNEKNLPLEARLSQAVRELLKRVQSLEKERLQTHATLSRHHLRLAQGFAMTLGSGALILALIGIFTRRRDVQAAWQSFFPSVPVGTRFGAPHGGGVIVEKSTH